MNDAYLFHKQELFEKLRCSDKGLSAVEAEHRLNVHGPNTIQEIGKTNAFVIFLSQFKSPIVWVLLVAIVISFIVGELVDVYVIAAIVVLNAILGFVQEFRAEKSIEALKKLVSLKAKVLRDGTISSIDAADLVPGDVILLETGDKVPADARLLESTNLFAQEAVLTGESVAEEKFAGNFKKEVPLADRKNMVFSGTIITRGHGKALVTGTGMSSEIGKIASMIQEAEPEQTHLQKKLKRLGLYIGALVVGIAVLVFLVGVIRLDQPITAILLTAIALAVAAIPEGLPAVVTVGLAVGVQRMAKRNALVRHLPSVETLGACTVICADKTGTLTHNEMTVRKLFVNRAVVSVSGAGYNPEGQFSHDPKLFELLLRIGALNNNASLTKEGSVWKVVGDPTEACLLVSARKAGLHVEDLHDQFSRVDEVEFTSERKLMTTVHKVGKERVSYVKGAPEVLLKKCSRVLVNGQVVRLSREEANKVLQQTELFAKQALRVLAFAYKPLSGVDKKPESDLIFVGLQAMSDPPRKEAKSAIDKCVSAGIKVVMITGDNKVTAEAVAKELGIAGKAVSGEELDVMENFDSVVETISVYARVNPAHKLKIVNALKAKGHVVAMTGDGVNDAPALKTSDLGVAMGSGTDVAKEASEIILQDDDFVTIVNAVEEGRRIFDNIQKYLAYLLSGNIGEVLVILCSILFGLPLPLMAIQILWINLVTDGLPALALSVDPAELGVMKRRPRKPEQTVFKGLEPYVYVYPVILTIVTLYFFDSALVDGLPKAMTIAFTTIVMFELFQAISCRSVHKSVFQVGLFANKWLWLAVFASVGLHLLILYVPALQNLFGVVALTLVEWLWILGGAIIGFAYLELHKVFFRWVE
ncbi:calcium-translocating P-type ATPase, SERCA-type [Candidatus Woesearchaeota archaeon CG10_big_fil_rev_8_21_14_0_10_37_12]|nr:MAG: calcium-translocating P-type ATPase, SERCA-type [Candidatus Woesearchaeota archaeon CG10_big_fil_rev_8_21_14_0_10_37_12]